MEIFYGLMKQAGTLLLRHQFQMMRFILHQWDRATEYFGVYNMMGKAAAVLGPLLMGGVTMLTGNHRYSILSICVLFVIGFVLLALVKSPRSRV